MADDFGYLLYQISGQPQPPYALKQGSHTIGRGLTCTLILNASEVSSIHARIVCTGAGRWIEDLGSTNGTWLNEERLPANERRTLKFGDQLRFATVEAQYVAEEAPPPPPTEPPNGARSPVPWPVQEDLRPRPLPPDRVIPRGRSRYMQLLPAMYQTDGDNFLNRFLLIFESVLGPLERTVGQLHYYVDPRLTPDPLLPWLAAWVGLAIDERWSWSQRRQLVARAVELYRWHGTRHGLTEYLRIVTGVTPQIIEPDESNPLAGAQPLPPDTFLVIIDLPNPTDIDRKMIEAVIESSKPAHTSYILELRRASA
jgi:phage tail-like protein